jgi:dihydrofolate reductase
MRVSMIVAVAENGVIGNKGLLPWRLSADLKMFKQLTSGKPVIMGRKTWDSLPRKPLPNRTNIVLTRDTSFAAAGANTTSLPDEAIALAHNENPDEVFIIGGADIFRAFLPLTTRIYLTRIHANPQGDVTFPIDVRTGWLEIRREPLATSEGDTVSGELIVLDRTPLPS